MNSPAILTLILVAALPFAAPGQTTAINCKASLPDAGFNFRVFQARVMACGFKKAEDAIAILPASYRSQFTLVYKSRSPESEGITEKNPRLIAFSKDGKSVFAVVGNADPRSTAPIQIQNIQFSDTTDRFTMNSIEISSHGPKPGKPNDARCLKCHGDNPRPIWDNYDIWPGLYGSEDDSLTPGTKEHTDFVSFLSKEAKQGVYGKLIWPKDDPTRYIGPYTLSSARREDVSHVPNGKLTNLWTALNAKRIAAMLINGPTFKKNQNQILKLLLRCDVIGTPVEPKIRTEVKQTAKEFVTKLQRQGHTHEQPRGPGQIASDPEGSVRLSLIAELAGVDRTYLSQAFDKNSHMYGAGLFPMLDVVASRLAQKAPSYFEPIQDLVAANQLDLNKLPKEQLNAYTYAGYDSIFKAYDFPILNLADGNHTEACKRLGAKTTQPGSDLSYCASCELKHTRDSLGYVTTMVDLAESAPSASAATGKKLIQDCAECHKGGDPGAPLIPFHDEVALSTRFKKDPALKGKIEKYLKDRTMPLYQTLLDDEIKRAVEYIQGL